MRKKAQVTKNKILKIISASGLAVMMGIGTLCGVLIAPMTSANAKALEGVANTQTGLDNAGLGGANGGGGYRDNGGVNGAASGEAVVLNPETDETIFKTESGFEIKSHTVAGQTLANSKVQYFTLGSYNGTALNWIILATSQTLAENTTDAGVAINSAGSKGLVSMMTDSKLSANQALVISEKVIPISTYTFSITTKSGTITGSLPGNGAGSGWTSGSYGDYSQYYSSLMLDGVADYYSSYTGAYSAHSSTINGWFTGSSLGLSSYCGNKIVKNSNFNGSYYGFALTNSQASTYLPTSLRAAKDTAGTARNYWCGDNITATCSVGALTNHRLYGSMFDIPTNMQYLFYASGSGTCSWSAKYMNTSGTLVSATATTTGTLKTDDIYSVVNNKYYYLNRDVRYYRADDAGYGRYCVAVPVCTYSTSGTTSITAYYRPAMVVDLSKF